MKKLIFFIALICAYSLSAQDVTMKSTYGGTTDSVTNAGTNWLKTYTPILITGTVTVQCVITKISGTAAGTAILQGSLDGTNWCTISLSTGIVTAGASSGVANDTFTLTNVTSQTCAWHLVTNQYSYYRVFVTGSGTELIRLSAKLAQRK